MSTETTPAIERASTAVHACAIAELHYSEAAMAAVSAALDVGEMATAMLGHQRTPPYNEGQAHCSCGHDYDTRISAAEHVATALRAAILGGAA